MIRACEQLAEIPDGHWQAFKAGRYPQEHADRYIKKVKDKIAQAGAEGDGYALEAGRCSFNNTTRSPCHHRFRQLCSTAVALCVGRSGSGAMRSRAAETRAGLDRLLRGLISSASSMRTMSPDIDRSHANRDR